MAYQYDFKAQTIIDEGRTTRKAIDEIKNWLLAMNFPKIPEELIVLFLISCQNVITATQNTIKAYFKIKREAPEVFRNRDVDSDELIKALKVGRYVSIPQRMENNVVVHFFKVDDPNYQNFDWVLCTKLVYMVLDISQRSDPPNELIVVVDMKGIGLMHVARLRLNILRKFLIFLQEAMPLKLKMLHILNSNYVFDKILLLGKLFMKKELLSIIKTHPPNTDMAQFHKDWIPAACLPKEYGGDLPSLDELNEMCIQKFRELKGFFEAEEKFIYELV